MIIPIFIPISEGDDFYVPDAWSREAKVFMALFVISFAFALIIWPTLCLKKICPPIGSPAFWVGEVVSLLASILCMRRSVFCD
jgi:hypothetical protein